MPLYLLFLTFFIAHNKNENDGIHTSSVEDRSQDKHVFSEIFEIQYRSQQLYLEKKFFLEAENSVSNAFWLFKLVNYKTLIFLPIFPTKLDCFQCIPPVGRAGWPIVPMCCPDARKFTLTWRSLLLHLLEWHFLGHLMCPFKFAEMSALCWDFSNAILLP